MGYIHLSSEGLNAVIREGLASAIRERNKIEREKLEFEQAVFEFNKQINIDSVKVNTDIANTIASMADNLNRINKNLEVLFQNDAWLKTKLDELDLAVANLM